MAGEHINNLALTMDTERKTDPTATVWWKDYHRITRTGTYGFLGALPLIVLYEVMIMSANQDSIEQVRVGAEIWLKQLISVVGNFGFTAMGIIVLLIGVSIFFVERKKNIPIRARYLGWMVVESGIYAVVVAFLVSVVVGTLFAIAPWSNTGLPQLSSQGLWMKLSLSIGAGIYEELVFRLLLVGGLYWVLKVVFPKKTAAYIVAALIGAAIFSAVHYIGALGDAFTLPSFMFRFLFGLFLNVIFLIRGFGIAAWTHALYDVMVVTGMIG